MIGNLRTRLDRLEIETAPPGRLIVVTDLRDAPASIGASTIVVATGVPRGAESYQATGERIEP